MKESNFKSNNFFDNIKSRYIMQKKFNNLLKIKSLHIIKNNKEIQKKLDITIKDYKQLSHIELKKEKIKIIIENKVKSLYKLFYSWKCIETITFQNYNRNNIEDMSCMFMCCSTKEINFSDFNTENVKNMSYMFDEWTSLKKDRSFKF